MPVNPLTRKSDQHQISPYNNAAESLITIIRIKEVNATLGTGSPSSSCEMIILQNKSHGKIIRVCMGIFTTALGTKIKLKNSQ